MPYYDWEALLSAYTNWVKPLKKSEKHRLRKELLKEGYSTNDINHMDTYQKRKLWKMLKERT